MCIYMHIHMYVCILLKYKTGNAQRLGHGVCLLSEGLHANSWLIVASLRETACHDRCPDQLRRNTLSHA